MQAVLLSLLGIIFAWPAAAAESRYSLTLRIPLYDSSRTQVADFSPSLGQAQALSQNYYLGSHWLFAKLFGSSEDESSHPLEAFTVFAFDYFSQFTPLGLSWLHEEGHRSVLNHFGIASHNGVYNANFTDGDIPVDRVRDLDLSRLKREHPADFVRLSTAGMEAESQFALNLEKAEFFAESLPRQRFLILLAHLGPIGYRTFCDSRNADAATRDQLRTEGPDEASRDFTGYDCVSYVYDLFRPHEPYEDRGQHPSGVGIKRYRSRDDLSSSEKNYLRRMASLSWINLVDPFLIDFKGWQWQDFRWTANLRHHLTPFGQSLEENIFLRRDQQKHLIIFRQYINRHQLRPGVEWQCWGCLALGENRRLDLRSGLWSQPKALLFESRRWQPGGFFALQIQESVSQRLHFFGEVLNKTRGWMADEIALEPASLVRIGLDWNIP